MKATDLTAPVIEPVTGRYDRDLLKINDDRKVRGFDYQAAERRERRYVDPATGETVSATGDNDPEGFDKQAFEDALVYNPNDAANAVEATSATAGAPGTFAPEGAEAPADLAALGTVTADPTTAWTEGQHVVLGDASEAYWDGSAWAAGQAPAA